MPLVAYTLADMLVSERKRLERPLLVLVWLSIITFGLAEGSPFYFLAGTLVVGAKLAGVQMGKEVCLRRLFVNIGVVLATAATLFDLIVGLRDPLTGLGHYLILILLCKVFERSANRDFFQMIALSLLIEVAAAMFCDKLWFAAMLAGYLVLACYTAMVFTLKRGLDAAAAARLSNEAAPLAPHRVAWNVRRDWPGAALRRRTAVAMLAMTLTGVALFLIAPRFARRALLPAFQGAAATETVSGFGGAVQLGGAKKIHLSDDVVLSLQVQTGQARPQWNGYLRGRVFDTYRNSRWSLVETGRRTHMVQAKQYDPAASCPAGMVQQTIHVPRSLRGRLLAASPPAWAYVNPAVGLPHMNAAGELMLLGPEVLQPNLDYVVWSWNVPLTPEARAAVSAQPLPPPGVIHVEPSVREQARQWCLDLLDRRQREPAARDDIDLAIAERLAAELRQRYRYSLDLSASSAWRDGVEDFLFYMKQGHCEYFASALTVMCSALDVRARLVGGFHVEPGTSVDGQYVVRDRDAHAWTEVYTPSTDWVVLDATPGGSPQPVEASWWSGLTDGWERLHQMWQEKVIRYDDASRQLLMTQIRAAWQSVCRFFQGLGRSIVEGLENLLLRGRLDAAIMWLAGAMGVAVVGVHITLLRRRWRQRRGTLAHLRRNIPWAWRRVRFLERFFRTLQRRGVAMPLTQTPMEIAARAAAQLNLPHADLASVIRFYYSLRWGGDAGHAQIAAIRQSVDRLSSALRRKPCPPAAGMTKVK